MPESNLLTISQVAQREQVRHETVLRWITSGFATGGKLPATKYHNGTWHVRESDLDEFLRPALAQT